MIGDKGKVFANNMYALFQLTGRNMRIFLKDKSAVFFSLLAPLIILLLYIFFLGDVQMDGVSSVFPSGVFVDEEAIKAYVDSWMIAGVMAVCCITVAFGANTVMVQDKNRGIINDSLSAPIKRWVITFSYFLYNFLVTLLISTVVLIVCFIYLVISKSWYLSAADVLCIIGTMLLSILSSTLITVFICNFIKSESALSAFTGIMSAVIGFIIGAYMPMSIMPKYIQYFSGTMPGSYSAGLFRNYFMRAPLDNLAIYLPTQAVDSLATAYSLEINAFGNDISMPIMYLILIDSIFVFAILNFVFAFKKKSKNK
jgi:multidrug/hemolysin transport system permease protein